MSFFVIFGIFFVGFGLAFTVGFGIDLRFDVFEVKISETFETRLPSAASEVYVCFPIRVH